MKITVKAVKVLKKGTNKFGDWKLVKVETDKDEEYTTLADDADQITGGSVINITDMDEDEKGKKFKKFEIISSEKAAAPSPSGKFNGGDMSKEDWEKKQRIERASFEAQTAYRGAIELIIAGKIVDKSKPLIDAAIAWGIKHLTEIELKEQLHKMPDIVKKPKPASETNGEVPDFKDGVALVNYALQHGYDMPQIKENLSINKPTEITDIPAAVAILYPKAKDGTEGLFD